MGSGDGGERWREADNGRVLSGVASSIASFMATAPSLPLLMVLAAVVGPVVVLVHELGHAAVARYLSGRPVAVQVGGAGPALEARTRGLRVTVHARRGAGPGAGLASYDSTEVSAVGAVLIALAGPLASAAGALAAGWALGAVASHGIAHDFVWVATGEGWAAAAINLIPMSISRRRGEPAMATDGLRALQAVRRIGRLPATATAAPAIPGPAPASPLTGDDHALLEVQRIVAQHGAPSSREDVDRALAAVFRSRPDLAAAVDRRIGAALRGRDDATAEERRAAVAAALRPGWRGE